jgi:ribosomal protein S18 acetylase RimI-like enzyme
MPIQVDPHDPAVLRQLQGLLSRGLQVGGPRYSFHPGDLAWWVHHSDPRQDTETYWVDGEDGLAVLGGHENEVLAFAVPGRSPLRLIVWGLDRVGSEAYAGMVSTLDTELEGELTANGMVPTRDSGPLFFRDLKATIPEPELPPGWSLRPVRGEEEADRRRAASHAAFESTMEPGAHLERYLRFMRSPVYEGDRDLVAVAPDGRIGAFIVWWPDPSGIAEIEPFGTDPHFHRQGMGRALMSFALERMREEGMTQARVITDADRQAAIAFYQAVGFEQVASLRDWKRS